MLFAPSEEGREAVQKSEAGPVFDSVSQTQFTTFPQSAFTMCKTCEKLFFFVRKANSDSNLQQVEKKSAKHP